jgi:hypothetical protein
MTWRTITFLGFGLVGTAALVWSAIASVRTNSLALGRVLGSLTRGRASRLIVLAIWAWLGLHLFVRGSGAFKK